MEQGECAITVGGVGPSDGPALIPHRNDASLADCSTESQLESMFNTLSEQGELFIPEMTVLTGTGPIDKGLWDDSDAPILLRQSSRSMKNQLPRRYQNFALQ